MFLGIAVMGELATKGVIVQAQIYALAQGLILG